MCGYGTTTRVAAANIYNTVCMAGAPRFVNFVKLDKFTYSGELTC